MNYSNVFPDGDGGFKFRVMIAREFLEKGGYPTEEAAAWECDKVRLWAGDLCGRKVAYNFPDRIANISDSDYSNTPADVSMFLFRLREKTGKIPEFPTQEDVGKARSALTQSPNVLTAEEREAQTTLLRSLNTALGHFSEQLLSAKFSDKQGEEFLDLAHRLQKASQLALIRLTTLLTK